MKPQDARRIELLNRCYTTKDDTKLIAALSQTKWTLAELGYRWATPENVARWIARMWNRYRMQIRHLQKVERMK